MCLLVGEMGVGEMGVGEMGVGKVGRILLVPRRNSYICDSLG